MAALDLDALEALARTRFAPRERGVHEAARLPLENLRDLYDAGWLRATLPRALGGAGSHLRAEDARSYLQAIRIVARVSPGTAHCLQVHNHAVWTLAELGTPAQHALFLRPLHERLNLISFIGSEPGLRPGASAFQTVARPRPGGGLRVDGRKYYATNGIAHGLGIVFASLEGVEGMAANHQMVIVTPDMPGVREEGGWYRPSGMRVAESPQVVLEAVDVPPGHLLGPPGAYLSGRWQGRFHLGFAANYLGAGEGAVRWALEWLRQFPDKVADPFVQMHVGEAQAGLHAAQAAFEQAIATWGEGDVVRAELDSMAAKATCASAAQSAVAALSRLAGSTALFDEHPLGRLSRDLQTHVLHVGHDRTYQTLGQAALGQTFDSTRQK
ncbi:MAG: acyl-CoA dehydrogenase family protein [Xenophilus sp.]